MSVEKEMFPKKNLRSKPLNSFAYHQYFPAQNLPISHRFKVELAKSTQYSFTNCSMEKLLFSKNFPTNFNLYKLLFNLVYYPVPKPKLLLIQASDSVFWDKYLVLQFITTPRSPQINNSATPPPHPKLLPTP